MPVDLQAAATSTLVLALAKQTCVYEQKPNVPATDYGKQPDVWNDSCPSQSEYNGQPLHQDAFNYMPFNQDYRVPVLPGTYKFEGYPQTPPDFVIGPGEVKDVSFTNAAHGTIPDTFETKITFADTAELPNAASGGFAITSNSCSPSFSDTSGTRQPRSVKAFQYSECQYFFTNNIQSAPIDTSKTNEIVLHRIEVDHVVVTKEDGSTYTQPGSVTVVPDGKPALSDFGTGYGIDVLPGKYDVIVKYETALGQQEKHYPVSF
jgi:hypothetical protein